MSSHMQIIQRKDVCINAHNIQDSMDIISLTNAKMNALITLSVIIKLEFVMMYASLALRQVLIKLLNILGLIVRLISAFYNALV